MHDIATTTTARGGKLLALAGACLLALGLSARGQETVRQPDIQSYPDRNPELFQPFAGNDLAADGGDVGDALGLIPADVISISFGASSAVGYDVFDTPATYFPTQGGSYLVLSTGATASALTANTAPDTSTELDGLNTAEGQDLTQVVLQLQPPDDASCLAFDFAFYSEEFPEFVGSQYNDAFIAEFGMSNFAEVNMQIIAPNNFAFDTNDNVVSVNTVFGVTAANADGTTYDGATPLLTAKTPLETPGAPITIILSIMDLGDSIYDSTVFVDNFRWLFGTACEPGADADTDRDALLNRWETEGIDFDLDGTIDLDLPAMGADPMHKDIFIEIDYMVEAGMGGHTHEPKADALQLVIDAFAAAPVDNPDGTTGINIHIDAGAGTIMDPVTNATWGALSGSDALTHTDDLGPGAVPGNYNWSAFDLIKNGDGGSNPAFFSILRGDVFHYCIFAHFAPYVFFAPDCATGCPASGISRGIPGSDFIVSLGGWTGDVGSINEQAGTLMHELGHNLELKHGGDDHANFEPNYLSIMNYFYQTRGLRVGNADGTFDYSRFALPAMDETDLDETVGLSGVAEAANYGTRYFDGGGVQRIVNDINGAVDWNGDGDGGIDPSVAVDVNGNGATSVLGNSDNWDEIVFNGGAVGHLGEAFVQPMQTISDDIPEPLDAAIPTDYGVTLSGPGVVTLRACESQTYTYEATNTGDLRDTYTVASMDSMGWADTLGLPPTLNLGPGMSILLDVPVTVPYGTPIGTEDVLVITLTSMSNALVMDSIETTTTAADDGDPVVMVGELIELWPPNHTYKAFDLSDCVLSVVDECDGELDVDVVGEILWIYSDEPENGAGDGNTLDDIVILGSSSFMVRKERMGGAADRGGFHKEGSPGAANGRVYGIRFRVTDSTGHTADATCFVGVPHDQSGPGPVDDGPAAGYTVFP